MLLEEKILGFNHLADLVKDFCLKLLSNNYSNQSCQIGSNGENVYLIGSHLLW